MIDFYDIAAYKKLFAGSDLWKAMKKYFEFQVTADF
jgi:hypothetical protein